ncbi:MULTISPECIES: hypothetical protein, partial [unclassified Brenneria]|uniref:hypothetical protein n=1 Tax=unclassified Brenneria TaxID=2634434 RepID=UPI001C13228B
KSTTANVPAGSAPSVTVNCNPVLFAIVFFLLPPWLPHAPLPPGATSSCLIKNKPPVLGAGAAHTAAHAKNPGQARVA